MSLTTPILSSPIKPFPATLAYDFGFSSIGGSQVTQNNLVIERTSDAFVVYNQTVQSFDFKHTLPANTLVNGTEYRVKVRTGDINNNFSAFSSWVVFKCFSTPVVSITNIPSGIVNNQTYIFEGSYSQVNGETLQSYKYLLYNENNILLSNSAELFDGLLKHQFTGLENNKNYKIELKVITVNGMEASSGLIAFTAQYIQPELVATMQLENFKEQASIKISANIIEIFGVVGSGTIQYEIGEWVNLHNGMVYFQDYPALTDNNMNLNIWVKNITQGQTFVKIVGQDGYIELKYLDDNRIHVYKYINNSTLYYHISSVEITPTPTNTLYINFKHINDLCDIHVEILV